MKKIVILTATRAEYGLLAPIIRKLMALPDIDTRVVATGAHLSPEFGMTVSEIERDGIPIDRKIEILLSSDTSVAVSKAMGLAMISFSEYFEAEQPDALMVLGDRYETLAVCAAAMNARVPIIHLYGGEATEGLIDEAVRNAITKLSYLHFTSTEPYRRRVIQLGEAPERVFNVGAMGVENAVQTESLSKEALAASLGCGFETYAVMTFHPVTLEKLSAKNQIENLLRAMAAFPKITFICTKANADMEGRVINRCIAEYASRYENIKLFDSLGVKRYLSALRYAQFVIGNSSSGIVEVPSFHIPTINIGDRQKGRIQAHTTINCAPDTESITAAIHLAQTDAFRADAAHAENPYGDGMHTSDQIVETTAWYLRNNALRVQKHFYDLKPTE